jgi:hypothetical protein
MEQTPVGAAKARPSAQLNGWGAVVRERQLLADMCLRVEVVTAPVDLQVAAIVLRNARSAQSTQG